MEAWWRRQLNTDICGRVILTNCLLAEAMRRANVYFTPGRLRRPGRRGYGPHLFTGKVVRDVEERDGLLGAHTHTHTHIQVHT